MSTALAEKKCGPCESGSGKLASADISNYSGQLQPEWRIVEQKKLEREFKFKDFKQALEFTNQVGQIAEEQNHHPDIYLTWGKVKISISTHSVGGLTENDFILAAKIDKLAQK